ncbi:periplasmic heavy metal sensor [Acetobacter sp. AN02]|nr:periplasmic heavy metal sensor [Acetobacter sp. AN02]MDG6095409.1 periplasmic heavy metal sensor [Acetobacter sp. AN02]
MSIRRVTTALLPVLAVVGTLGTAAAHPPGGPGGPGYGIPPFLHDADLTDKQKSEIHTIIKQARESSRAARTRERSVRDQIDTLLMTPGKIDQTQLTALTQQETTLQAQAAQERMTVAVKIHDLMTDKQLTEAKEKHDKIKALMDQIHQISHPKDEED